MYVRIRGRESRMYVEMCSTSPAVMGEVEVCQGYMGQDQREQ